MYVGHKQFLTNKSLFNLQLNKNVVDLYVSKHILKQKNKPEKAYLILILHNVNDERSYK